MKKMKLSIAGVAFGILCSCQSNVDVYEAQKKEHFGRDYYTTVTFENDVKVDEKSLEDITIDKGTIVKDTVIKGTKYGSKFKYFIAIGANNKPLELLISGTGIIDDGTPQEMTSEEFGAGVLACATLHNVASGQYGNCLGNLIFTAQMDCCFYETGVDEDCWIGCPQEVNPNWPD